ncbi:DUF3347 domain-containing protein [Taibaiella koreensis]|uniref:DUF3347 domain-containing protein n=1 Tax=Taibaiella koreensis TaxID=1268548 RepID=UPI000E59FDD1|nr:DUF3347 domain-containing protein [Taibaiella koreensis]
MKWITAVMAAAFISTAAQAQDQQSILDAYLKVKDDLVQSDGKKVSGDIVFLQKALAAVPASGEKEPLARALGKMAQASGIDGQRNAFAEVSAALWKVVKGGKNVDGTVYYQYCPMKKSYWLSVDAGVKNPYYGSQMLSCGKTVETLK